MVKDEPIVIPGLTKRYKATIEATLVIPRSRRTPERHIVLEFEPDERMVDFVMRVLTENCQTASEAVMATIRVVLRPDSAKKGGGAP